MVFNLKDCPDDEVMISYVFEELPFENVAALEEHLYLCAECTDRIRHYIDIASELSCMKASSTHGRLYKEYCCDVAFLPAAGSETNKGISETKSADGKYIIRLIPFLKGDSALLEVELTNRSVTGTLVLENSSGIVMEAPAIRGFARQEVSGRIDLRDILIKVI